MTSTQRHCEQRDSIGLFYSGADNFHKVHPFINFVTYDEVVSTGFSDILLLPSRSHTVFFIAIYADALQKELETLN